MKRSSVALVALAALTVLAHAQHLVWRPKDDQGSYRCIYGEINVLATAPTTYYCGCNWWPSCPAGGYTGIQDLDNRKHAMIFSVWDTTPELRSVPVERGDARAQLSRFGGEGEGGKTMLSYNWALGRTYRYFIVKRQDEANNRTLASAYFYDDYQDRWIYDATIASPNNGDKCIKGFGGMMNAFLENYGGQAKDTPRLALYRLWVGTTPDDLAEVTEASGNGTWGVTGNSFFLASGDGSAIRNLLEGIQPEGAHPNWGADGRLNVPEDKLSPEIVQSLQGLVSGGTK